MVGLVAWLVGVTVFWLCSDMQWADVGFRYTIYAKCGILSGTSLSSPPPFRACIGMRALRVEGHTYPYGTAVLSLTHIHTPHGSVHHMRLAIPVLEKIGKSVWHLKEV
jgi:hypothetical protein